MKYIESAKNPRVKQWKKLLTKKERDKTGRYLIEGFHLVEEALKEASLVQAVILSEDAEVPVQFKLEGIEVIYAANDVLKAISDTETPQGITAVCEQREVTLEDIDPQKLLLIDAVQDPGNIGTMIRTADAAGIDAVILGEGCADPYNPKVIRSTQGSIFHLPVIKSDLSDIIDSLQNRGIPVYGTALENAVSFEKVEKVQSFALLVGNEGQGVAKQLLSKTTQNLYIPIYGKSESLNVGIAAGILLYHLRK
ncbi:RNA methyltransferase [Peribacillus cavernae]|uniref:RNA methyltransferase n=1 Tax=Peribacillus cavernae TaxID=1674310 RepID=A0A3S0TX68_9BACI|nr:RNA methyltransferase [Peribacillus cavernae]MDQ0220113.1 TrmH family RNA methyltransferase [Peribacillus cavernae]RUQ25473.1 RNA methyltransferase [Peribacillus cavernae]